ncbi:MAG: aldolase/citrate lyase family protein, partial [Actinomycetes bacterium]
MIARSYLYVPGNNMAMLSKADSRGADAIIVDFEDSVS